MTGGAGDAGARAHAEEIARGHDENFPVAFMLAPRDVRADMRTIYAYCRVTDDIGDAGDATRDARVAMLDAWEDDLLRCWGGAPHDPVLLALQGVVRRRRLDPEPSAEPAHRDRVDAALVRKLHRRVQDALSVQRVPRFLALSRPSDDDASVCLTTSRRDRAS